MDLNALKEQFIQAGGNLHSAKVQRKLDEADQKARTEANALSAPPNAKAALRIRNALGYLAVGFFNFVLIVGTALLLTFVPIAEFLAVYDGIMVITPKPAIVALTTFAIFVGILVLTFMKNVYLDALPNGRPKVSLKDRVLEIGNTIGFTYRPTPASSMTKVELDYVLLSRALFASKASIYVASFIGRMSRLFDRYGDLPVSHAVKQVMDSLTFIEAIGIITALVILAGLIKILDVGVLITYTAFKNSAGALDLAEARPTDFLDVYPALSDQYQSNVLTELIMVQEHLNSQNYVNKQSS